MLFNLFQNQVDFHHAYNSEVSKKQLLSQIEQKLYPPRFIFEVSERSNHRGYFKERRHLSYEIIGGKVGDVTKISHTLSVPPYTGKV